MPSLPAAGRDCGSCGGRAAVLEPRRRPRDLHDEHDPDGEQRERRDDRVDAPDLRGRLEPRRPGRVEQPRQRDGGGQLEPDAVSQRRERGDEQQRDRPPLERRQCPPAGAPEADGDESRSEEEHRRALHPGRLPLGDVVRERRAKQHQPVVRDQPDAVGRRQHTERRADEQHEPAETRGGRPQEREPVQRGQPGAEADGAVEVRPHRQDRQREEDAPARSPRIGGEQRVDGDEGHEREALRANLGAATALRARAG